jgi:hypothetical protein
LAVRLQFALSGKNAKGILPEAPSEPRAVTAVCLTPVQQWERLANIVRSAIASAEDASLRQNAAHQQLDLAQYALYTLGDELSAVMKIPGRRQPASVHVLEAPATLSKSPALAA